MTDTTTRPLGPADEALIAAEQEIADLRRKGLALSAAGDAGDHEEIWNRVFALEKYIAMTAPDSMIGAAVKLRRLADDQIGLEAGKGTGDAESVRQILAMVEHSITGTSRADAPAPDREEASSIVALVEQGGPLPMFELHRRWAAAQGEYERLGVEIDERESEADLHRPFIDWCGFILSSDADIEERAAQRAFAFPNQREQEIVRLKSLLVERQRSYEAGIEAHGIEPQKARHDSLAAEIDRLLDEIAERPVQSIEDIAIRLDVAIECDINDGRCEWPWLHDAARGLAALRPAVFFTSFRRNVALNRALDSRGIPTDDGEKGGAA
jgi:hypothetical protein